MIKVDEDSPDDEKEPWEFDKNLISKDEKIQDAALKKVFTNIDWIFNFYFSEHIIMN